MPQLQCIVVTPEQTLRDTPAEFVALTLHDGEIGIAPDHAPMLGRLGVGELRITNEGKVDRYYIEDGFVEVLDNVVSVLTGRVVPVGELDELALAEQFEAAKNLPAGSSDLAARRDRQVDRCRAQLRAIRRQSPQ